VALVIWVGGASLFYIFEHRRPGEKPYEADMREVRPRVLPGKRHGILSFLMVAVVGRGHASLLVTSSLTVAAAAARQSFESIPKSLFYTAVFLGGEWGKCDFTVAGSFVMIFFVVVGIELYAIPIANLAGAFQEVRPL
jgi:hypothetical protein